MRALLTAASMVPFVCLLIACSEDECAVDDDCPMGRICRLGLCALDPNGLQDISLPDGIDVVANCDAAAAGDLVLNEILADPPSGVDVNMDGTATGTNDEFVEIVNISGKDVDLEGVQISVNGNATNLGNFCLPPNTARLLNVSLLNSGATVALLIDGATAQTHTYGSEGGQDESLTLQTQLDPTSGWVKHSTIAPGVLHSYGKCANGNDFPNCTGVPPGDVDPDAADAGDSVVANCSIVPMVGDLMINEVLADPGTVLDANQDGTFNSSEDEFVEIVNVSAATLLLTGVTISEGANTTFTFPAATCLAPNQAAVMFGKYTSGGAFGGALAFGFGGSFGLNNSGDTVTIKDAGGNTLATAMYGSDANFDQSVTRMVDLDDTASFVKHSEAPLAAGAAMSPGTCQNGNSFPDCAPTMPEVVESTADVAEGTADVPASDVATETMDDAGTDVATDAAADVPMDTGPTCGPAAGVGDLVINEVMGNAGTVDANMNGTASATNDEYTEIVSTAGTAVDLTGVVLKDAANNAFTFGSVCLEAGNAVLVFTGTGAPFTVGSLPAGNAPAQVGGPGINNGAETLSLRSAADVEIDLYSHTAATAGVSFTRDPDKTGAFVSHSAATGAVGANSPGLCLNGNAFPSCQ